MIKKLFLFFSSFIPLFFLVIVKIIVEIINNNLTFNITNTTLLSLMIIFVFCGIIGFIWNTKFNNNPSKKIKILEVQNTTDQHFLGYFSLFVLFALSFELERVSMFCVFLIIMCFIGIVYLNSNLFYINPFLNILGYNFYSVKYKVQNENIIEIREAKIFAKIQLEKNKTYYAKLDIESFSFIDTSKKDHY